MSYFAIIENDDGFTIIEVPEGVSAADQALHESCRSAPCYIAAHWDPFAGPSRSAFAPGSNSNQLISSLVSVTFCHVLRFERQIVADRVDRHEILDRDVFGRHSDAIGCFDE